MRYPDAVWHSRNPLSSYNNRQSGNSHTDTGRCFSLFLHLYLPLGAAQSDSSRQENIVWHAHNHERPDNNVQEHYSIQISDLLLAGI